MTPDPTSPAFLAHGGSGLDVLSAHYPYAPRPWIDLSTGINPWPYPAAPTSAPALQTLPSPSLYRRCREAHASYLGIDASKLALLPGSQAAISLTPRLFPTTTVAVVEPTYGEHGASWRQAGHSVISIADPKEARGADVLVITNPNNPDGRTWERAATAELAARQRAHNGWLILDEAFGDAVPHLSAAQLSSAGNVVIFRSFGKFFGLAGIRLGFAVAPIEFVRQLEDMIGPWAVSGPALEIGAAAYSDLDWHAATRKKLHGEALKLRNFLDARGLANAGDTDLFLLAKHPGAGALFDCLCRQGIYVRRFKEHPHWLRFGLPANEAVYGRLEQAFAQWSQRQ